MFYSIFLFSLFFQHIIADTPANCTYEDAHGKWEFYVNDYELDCTEAAFRNEPHVFTLLYPNIAVDEYGNSGTWTLIYNQGFEVTVAYRKWLVMFGYNNEGMSFCNIGMPSWTHDVFVRQWKCFRAKKVISHDSFSRHTTFRPPLMSTYMFSNYQPNYDMVNAINQVQSLWKAKVYDQFVRMTRVQLNRMKGGFRSGRPRAPFERSLQASPEVLSMVEHIPESFDWRYPLNGMKSPVTPIRNQGSCGSCYAFASAAALESRIRLVTNFTEQPILSPQDIVDCSKYSEGCQGGFPYLIAGKYAEDFGMVEENCNVYQGVESGSCTTVFECKRYYATNYRYIGGYYGACNEDLMKLELVQSGPFPVGFEVYDDFIHYESGVYKHTGIADSLNRYDPFELTNHAVLLVGYGFDNATRTPYWIVKNSWGSSWGENGFFRILRGHDECAIESLGVRFDPVI